MRELAKRLTAQFPDPPRPVSPGDLLWVYGPLLGYTCFLIVVLIAFSLIVGLRGGLPTVAGLVAVMVVGLALMSGTLVVSIGGALSKGVYVTGEVVSAGGMTAVLRVPIGGQANELNYSSRSAGSLQPGQRLDLMVDTENKKVLLLLGPATT